MFWPYRPSSGSQVLQKCKSGFSEWLKLLKLLVIEILITWLLPISASLQIQVYISVPTEGLYGQNMSPIKYDLNTIGYILIKLYSCEDGN